MRPARKLALVGVAQRLTDHLPERWGRRARELGKIAVNHRGERRTALRHVQYQILRRTSPVLAAPFGPGRLIVDAQDDEIGRTVFLSGGYERWYMEAATRALQASGLDPAGKVFLDVGANIGTSTIDALLQFGFGRAVCFEPAPENARLLRVNLVLNELEERATVYGFALSDHDGSGRLERSATNSGDQRFNPSPEDHGDGSIACKRLDTLVGQGLIDPSDVGLLWMDTQGHEARVLAGATTLLEAQVPTVLEYCPWMLGDSIADLDQMIADHYSVIVDLRLAAAGVTEATLTPDDLPDVARRFAQRRHADLLLLPGPAIP